MRAADLKRAGELALMLQTIASMLDRLRADEPLRLILGSGGKASEIGLTAEYLDRLRIDVSGALELRAGSIRAELAAMGVEQ